MAEHVLGPVADFPAGSHKIVQIRKLKIGVFNLNGDFYALPNICPHQFGPLSEGGVAGTLACTAATNWNHEWIKDGEILTCPWHGIEFDIRSGAALASPKLKVRHYPISVVDDQVVLTL
jgi:nitrite reductase/ring-hydroxylating ferredoxin subunit